MAEELSEEENSKGMSNKTLYGIMTFNCRNIVPLDEHERQLEQKEVRNRLVDGWISRYEHKSFK